MKSGTLFCEGPSPALERHRLVLALRRTDMVGSTMPRLEKSYRVFKNELHLTSSNLFKDEVSGEAADEVWLPVVGAEGYFGF